jgi:hypothetical protein
VQNKALSKLNEKQVQSIKDKFGMSAKEFVGALKNWYVKAMNECQAVGGDVAKAATKGESKLNNTYQRSKAGKRIISSELDVNSL